MLGTIKSVEVPISQLDNVLKGSIMFDGSSIEGFVRIKEADMYLEPDLSTWLILPLESSEYGKVARFICDVKMPNGEFFSGDPRSNLKRVLKKLDKFGFEKFCVGFEPEFYLFKLDEKGEPRLSFIDKAGYFDLAPLDGSERCRHDIVLELEKLGFRIEASHHEVGYGQNEINFCYSDAIETCDNLQTFKLVVTQIAKKYNLHASFMPKPVATISGNALHTNCSIMDKNGKNVFFDPNDDRGLSDICHKWVSGILKHARAYSAITNPTVNSYKRLVPGYEAPCYICWSDANRSAMVRLPAIRNENTRTEVRCPDPGANPYLVLASILSAGLDGIEKNLPKVEPVDDNIFEYSRQQREELGIKNLPENLKDAVKELSKSELMKETLGEHIFKKYTEAKTIEWDEYRKLVHDWEIDRYL